MQKRAVVLGDPSYFRIKSGSNPHTRNRWGIRKGVAIEKAVAQWNRLSDLLKDIGLQVLIIPPERSEPGMVFPANAGVVIDRDDVKAFSEKTFLISHLFPGRSGEEIYYEPFFRGLGFKIVRSECRFEGEADFFPVGDQFIFTYGRIEKPRFQFVWKYPPFQRIYGFRTQWRALVEVQKYVPHQKILPIELTDDRFYHGDTAICPIGDGYILAYLAVLSEAGVSLLKQIYGEKLIPLTREDAEVYGANSFYVESQDRHFLIMPVGVSDHLKGSIKERGIEVLEADVSEFFLKGGGSVKCMILDLGPIS